jgi:uncharacterized repeat protein (TIGR01451 family)
MRENQILCFLPRRPLVLVLSLTLGFLLLLALAALAAPGMAAPDLASVAAQDPVVINEFLADPADDITGDANGDGTREASQDEFVEIVNVSGGDLDLSGWTLEDGASVRHTFPAETVVPGGCSIVVFGGGVPTGGFGGSVVQTASGGLLGLNNGGDAITLTNPLATVVVTYTYGSEGGNNQSLTRDPDITGPEPLVYHSTAAGSGGALFSPGTMISGTAFAGCAPEAQVLINETDADTPSTDTLEFIELYDGGGGNTVLDGLVVVLYNGSGDVSYYAFDLDGYTTDGEGYFVIGSVPEADIYVSPGSSGWLQNGADAVALYLGDAVDFPNGTLVTADSLVDAIVYDTDDADDAELLVLLNVGQPQVNENGAGDKDNHSNQRCPNGSGDPRNTDTYVQKPSTPGAANDCAIPIPDVVINEVDSDTPSYDTLEFIELYDGGGGNTALDGLVVVLFNGSDDLSYEPVFDLDGYATDGEGYFVIGSVAGADLYVDPGSQGWLQNGADAVALYLGDAADFPNDTPLTTDNLVDAIVYDTDDGDDAGLLVLLNAGQPQVNENGGGDKDNHSNQRCPNGSGGLRNTDTYAQRSPTPDTENICELPPVPDLELSKSVNDHNPGEGDTITFTLELANSVDGAAGATNVVIRDYLPSTTTQVIYLDNTCGATVGGGVVNWTVGSIMTGTSVTCDIIVEIQSGTAGTHFSNLAEVFSSDQPDLDSTAGNLGAAPAEDDEDAVTVWVGTDPVCGTAATYIHTIQGSGPASPEDGNTHTIEGVVVGDFQDTSVGLRGFFLQEEDADADAEPMTSEGIFVYDSGFGVDVHSGDVVRVTGRVDEYSDLTELTSVVSVTICSAGNSVTPAQVTLPISDTDYWEWYEGMLVTIPQTLYATGNYDLGHYGELDLSVGGRLDNPTNVVAPGAPAIALQDLNDRSRIQLDDGSNVSNPPVVPYLGSDNTLRAGDTIPELTGVLGYAFGTYEIHPTEPVSFTRINVRDSAPHPVEGTIKVASFNVLNYFTTIDTGALICGPSGDMECRGADSAEELARQRAKIVSAIVAMDADVVGLIEIENPRDDDPTDDALLDLVSGLNDAAGAGTYAYIDTGYIGTDAIKQALVYKPGVVTPVGTYAVLDSSVYTTFLDTLNRPVLAQTFAENATGERFTVAVNHLKSKGSSCDAVDDPDTGDGQGNCNLTRLAAATALADWLATDPTGSGDSDFLIIGDLNSYAMEDPVAALKSRGYTDLVNTHVGPSAYSYVFEGQSGYLDHALGDASMAAQVTGVTIWHVNADEPSALNYNDYNQPYLYNPDPFSSSDHDPVIVGLYLWRSHQYLPLVMRQ